MNPVSRTRSRKIADKTAERRLDALPPYPDTTRGDPAMPKLAPGATVRVERDETKRPSRGTWPQFRGKTGTIVEVNRAGGPLPEYGVVFSKVTARTDGRGAFNHGGVVTWFKSYELRVLNGAP